MKTFFVLILAAALAPAAPAQEPAKPQDLEATLVAIKGTVDVKRPEDKDWVPAERNMKLKKGSEICTSIASTASLLLTGNVKVDVKPMTQAKIEDLAKAGDTMNADVKLKFGQVEVDIQKGDLRSDMKVSSPNSTTSVSGSNGIVRAPATEGGCRITLRTTTGTWRHDASQVGRGLIGEDVADNFGNQLRDFRVIADSHDFLDFWGRSKDELYQSRFNRKAADPDPWDVPMFEFATQGPTSGRVKRSSLLPLPRNTVMNPVRKGYKGYMKLVPFTLASLFLCSATLLAQENIFITNSGGNTVTVIDAQTLAPLPSSITGAGQPPGPNPIGVGAVPNASVYDPVRKLVYVVNSGNPGTVSVIDVNLFKVTATIAIPDAISLAAGVLSPDGNFLFMAGFENIPKRSAVFQLDLNNLTNAGAKVVAGLTVGDGRNPTDVEVLPASAVGGSGNAPGRAYITVAGALYEVNLPAAGVPIMASVPLPVGVNAPSAIARLARSPDGRFILATSTSNFNAGSVWQPYLIRPTAAAEVSFFTLNNTGNANDSIDDVLFLGTGGPSFDVSMMTRDDAGAMLTFFSITESGAVTGFNIGPDVPSQFGGQFTYDRTRNRYFIAWAGSTAFPNGYQVFDAAVSPTTMTQLNSTGGGPLTPAFAPQPPRLLLELIDRPGGVNSAPFQLDLEGRGFIPGSTVVAIVTQAGVATPATTATILSGSDILATFPGGAGAVHFDVRVRNSDGQESILGSFFQGLAANPPSPPFTVDLPALTSGYRMLSFPQYATLGDLRKAQEAQLGAYNPILSRLFVWEGRYFEINDPKLSPSLSIMGTGFFALSRLGDSLTLSSPDVAANTTGGERVIALSPGWNIISQPWLSGTNHVILYSDVQVTTSPDLGLRQLATASAFVTPVVFDLAGGKYSAATSLTAGKAYWVLNQQATTVYMIFRSAFVTKPTSPVAGASAASGVQPPPPPGQSLNDSGGSRGGCGLLGPELVLLALFLRGRGRRRLSA